MTVTSDMQPRVMPKRAGQARRLNENHRSPLPGWPGNVSRRSAKSSDPLLRQNVGRIVIRHFPKKRSRRITIRPTEINFAVLLETCLEDAGST